MLEGTDMSVISLYWSCFIVNSKNPHINVAHQKYSDILLKLNKYQND